MKEKKPLVWRLLELSLLLSYINPFSNMGLRIVSDYRIDIADEPITEGNFEIDAKSENADNQKLQEILAIAEEKCPAMYSMRHVIKVNATIR